MAKGNHIKKNKAGGKGKAAVIAIVSVVVILAAAFVGTGIWASSADKIYPNVTLAGIDIGSMTYEEAYEVLENRSVEPVSSASVTVILSDTVSLEITPSDAGFVETTEDAVKIAMRHGKDGGFFGRTLNFIKSLIVSDDIVINDISAFDEENVRALIKEAARHADHGLQQTTYSVMSTAIIIEKGSEGFTVDQDAVYDYIYGVFKSGAQDDIVCSDFSESVAGVTDINELDFGVIYDSIYVEPVSAKYDTEKGEVTQSVQGVSFDIDGAKELYAAAGAGDTVRVPLIFTDPEFTSADVEAVLFRDCLSEKATSLATSSLNRITNVSLSAQAINGLVLNPGDEFSFNGVVGQRTSAKGYKPAGAYVSGKSVDQIGGGICQTSSTIYYCALMANLEITERYNHMFTVAYLPIGLDATVNWGTLDFRFKNNTEYPIRIVSYVEEKQLFVEIWGTKTDETSVKLESTVVKTLSYEVIETVDETLSPGERVVDTWGHEGYVVDSYSTLLDADGNTISRTYLGRSSYRKLDTQVRVGPEPEEPDVPDEPTEPDTPTTDPDEPTTPDTPDAPVVIPDPDNDQHGEVGENQDTETGGGIESGDAPSTGENTGTSGDNADTPANGDGTAAL